MTPRTPPNPGDLDPDELVADNFLTNPRGAALLELLRAQVPLPRIVAIGRYRRTWTPAEVAWAKRYYIDAAPEADQWVPTGYAPQRLPFPAQSVDITHRQAGILDAICRGLTAAEIAAEAGLARNTVDQHTRGVLRAIGAGSREEAATLARTGRVRLFLVEPRGGRPSRGMREAS